jgi:hypothetical protein
MFCDSFFAYPSPDEVINDGKNRPLQEKYNLNTYWDNGGEWFPELGFEGLADPRFFSMN